MPLFENDGKKNLATPNRDSATGLSDNCQLFSRNQTTDLVKAMNAKFPCLLAAVIILSCALGCRTFSSAGGSTNQSSNSETAAAPTPVTLENSNVTGSATPPTPTPPPNAVCPDPAKPCQNKTISFDEWAISFKLPTTIQPNKTYTSTRFYAIIVKTLQSGDEDLCDGGEYIESLENERRSLQREHPGRKVFASYSCPNMSAAEYEFPGSYDRKTERSLIDNFIAVYAGQSKEDAEKLLPALKTKYPDAAIKPMTASAEWIDQ